MVNPLRLRKLYHIEKGKLHKAELVTGDPEFKAVEKNITIQWLR